MRYVALRSQYALEALEALRRRDTIDEQRLIETRGSGEDVEQVLPALARELSEIKSRYPERLSRRDPAGGKFEAEACAEIHRALPFDPQMLADYEWWTWLAVFRFRELVDWRHGGEAGHAAPANFGIGNGSENLLYRMWLRADVGYDPNRSDPYELARRGDQDFWRSHVFRQGYGRCRSLVKALIRYQFPDGSIDRPTLKIDEIRELAKRLRRLHPNIFFEYLAEEDAYRLVQQEAERAKQALAVSVSEQ
ncbi:MAG: hypothetical protein KatS3mg015_2578 [Fimbriimonadales bacterium]|nr:MAG: hypothetical protein KatS3mg015_2578 [Fimbriimonadales bacterium]